ncbi:MAG: type II toxin-antitoxin system VapC family toxin [Bryobacter sp.]|nr:type II toxin-antitoxin system VapC family toxin [Bryobacter sp.]
MILLDTSALVGSLAGGQSHMAELQQLVLSQEELAVSSIVLYEFWRGPRQEEEIERQQLIFPEDTALPFTEAEASIAAKLFREVRRARVRQMDLAIAATAIVHGAGLWTLNPRDFVDVPGLRIVRPRM